MSKSELINDIRNQSQFQGYSFSNHKKTEVKTQIIQNILNEKIEESCYWSAELICAGHYSDLWEIIIFIISKHIYLGNPKICLYVENRFNQFKNILSNGEYIHEIELRNDFNLRKLFAEIICLLCYSNKKPAFELIKLGKKQPFDLTTFGEKLKAKKNTYANNLFLEEDPKELYIPVNEFMFHISNESKNSREACYWIEWFIEFSIICKKKKNKCLIQTRMLPVQNKFKNEPIWLLWDAIMLQAKNDPFVNKLIDSLLNIFCIKFTEATPKKRRYLLYYAVSLIIENVDKNIPLINDKTKIEKTIENISNIYKQIKKNEQSPNTEYLFHNVENENNLKKSLAKMNLVNSIDVPN